MRHVARLAFFCILATVSGLAQPKIYSLTNNYSYIPPGFPNYGIAQGSIFDVFGSGLAPLTTDLQSMPLQTMLDGVSLVVTVNGVTTHPLIYYLSPTQIAAVLPSGTPPGLGQITVTNAGATSPAALIQVVPSALGLATSYPYGNAASAFDANWAPLDTTNAANPGDYITLWGSGLGPVTGDETVAPAPVDLSAIPIEVDIGGFPATVTYHGRSGSPGLDQINVLVPKGVSGCSVSVAVRIGGIVSNFAMIPVAASGRACSDPLVVNWPGSGGFQRMGSLSLSKSVTYEPNSTVTTESATATFQEGEIIYGAAGLSVGSCFVYRHFGNGWAMAPNGPFLPLPPLDAGPAINISGPLGSASLLPQQKGYYSGVIGGTSGSGAVLPALIPDAGGDFTFGNGVGGTDVGPFTAPFVVLPLIWTNMKAVSTVSLKDGLTVAWSNGAPNTAVTIGGTSTSLYTDQTVVGYFECVADAAAGTFSVPEMVLQSLPASTIQGYFIPLNGPASSLSISNTTTPIAFDAPGLAQGAIAVGFTITNSVQYK